MDTATTSRNRKSVLNTISQQGATLRTKSVDAIHKETNQFPVAAFPEPISKIILELNRVYKYPIDFTAAGMISAAATAIGNSHIIQIDELRTAIAVIYIAGVGEPSINKSSPFNFAFSPLNKRDEDAFAEYERAYVEYEKTASLSPRRDKISIYPILQ